MNYTVVQALLHEKEGELEERSRLLFKTKVVSTCHAGFCLLQTLNAATEAAPCVQLAIEQLQQELIATKREGETARERAIKVCL